MENTVKARLYRKIPQVEHILKSPAVADLINKAGRGIVLSEINGLLASIRDLIAKDAYESAETLIGEIEPTIAQRVNKRMSLALTSVVNATGVIIHTNLGRALLSKPATEALAHAARQYTNLEFNLERGERSTRDKNISQRLSEFLGCEAATVVNNNAAAVFLILNTLALGKEVIVSRGELIEIGGSFRIPDIMQRSGVLLREVGTTNKTKLSDYEAAINENTGLILRIHPSNYRIIGFTARPELSELVDLGARFKVPIAEDLGSGCLVDLSPYGITDEPAVQESLKAGVDLACFSGDKLLGGPQAGIIVGQEKFITRLRRNPLMRVLRVDKLTYSALEATLLSYLTERAFKEIPTLAMIAATRQQMAERVANFRKKLEAACTNKIIVKTVDGYSVIGGGACPEVQLPTQLIALTAAQLSATQIEERLRRFQPPIVTRVEEDQVLIDLRTVLVEQEDTIITACARL